MLAPCLIHLALQALTPAQAVEINPVGTNGHVPAAVPVDIRYTTLKPTLADQVFYIDGQLHERRPPAGPQFGPQIFQYSEGIPNGDKRLLRICIDEDAADEACGYAEMRGGPQPAGVDVPELFSAADLSDHFQVLADCKPVCGYYSNVYYGDPEVSWVPERGDGLPDGLRMDLYYSSAGGHLDAAAAPSTLVIYAHSAGSNKESLLTRGQSLLRYLLHVARSGSGVVVASVHFRHPLKQLANDLTPVSVADLSYAVQFARYHAAELNIDPENIFLVATSLGAGVAVHAGAREIASPSDPSPVRRVSSAVRGVIARDAQTSFSPHWFRSHFLEAPVAARYQRDLLDDEYRLIYGHAPAGVNPDSPQMELLYTGSAIDHKVTAQEYLSRTVDVVHLPNYGLAMEAQYRLYGIEDRIRVVERYSGNFSLDAARFVAAHRGNTN
ncbi:MAG: hypothetical protein CME36_13715 [unclassified Hahellaceae]|nr:hypothetical protein [Hahellaceae bacterium]|tara:strand:+ start:6154 stop:7473 length:1320 start_codon:yes stop_codon:yes gene_type:complete